MRWLTCFLHSTVACDLMGEKVGISDSIPSRLWSIEQWFHLHCVNQCMSSHKAKSCGSRRSLPHMRGGTLYIKRVGREWEWYCWWLLLQAPYSNQPGQWLNARLQWRWNPGIALCWVSKWYQRSMLVKILHDILSFLCASHLTLVRVYSYVLLIYIVAF